MDDPNIIRLFDSLYEKLVSEFNSNGIKFDTTGETLAPEFVDAHLSELPLSMSEFYRFLNGFRVVWKKDEFCSGEIWIWNVEALFGPEDILPVDEELGFVVYNDDHFVSKNKISGCFRILDYYDPVKHVGFFSDPKMSFKLFFRNGIEFWDLKLDFEGYLRMAFAARFFDNWPSILAEREYRGEILISGKYSETWKEFHEHMPIVFPGFSCDEFFALYDSLKRKD
jgi:hypothetical protein